MLSPPEPISIQSLLYKTTTCLIRPATASLSPKLKKLSKTTTAKLFPPKKWEAMHKKLYFNYIYSIATL